jgi:nitrogen regulatory protein P-II 1
MKHIKAIIQPEKLMDVRDALKQAGCFRGIMISDIMGHGVEQGVKQTWRGEVYQMDLLPKVMIDLVVKDSDVPVIKDIIIRHARTGEIGDGKIFVYPVEEVIRIRTGEEGEDAL